MSRRSMRQSARGRRTPARPKAGGGVRIPWVPIVSVAGVAVVVALIGYLIYQAGQPAGEHFEAAVAAEADSNPDLPGEWVNLPQIYGGFYGNKEGPTTNDHVQVVDIDYEAEQGLPPVGGDHWGSTGCADSPAASPQFCGPATWGVYREPWPAATMVHNMEHGGVVVWYNTTDQEVIDDLEDLITDRVKNDLVLLTPYPEMEKETVAVTSWSRRDKFPASEYDRDRVNEFIDAHLCRFDPEGLPGC